MTLGHARSAAGRMSVNPSGAIVHLELSSAELQFGESAVVGALTSLHSSALARVDALTVDPYAGVPATIEGDPLVHARRSALALAVCLNDLRNARGVGESPCGITATADAYGNLVALSVPDPHRRRVHHVEAAVVAVIDAAVHEGARCRDAAHATLRAALLGTVHSLR